MNSIRKKGIVLFLLMAFAIKGIRSQNIGINSSGATPNLSAMLDVDVTALITKKGLLIPRMTSAEKTAMNPLPAAAQGLIVYQTDGVQGFYYNTSTTTIPVWAYLMPSGSDWLITGNTGTTASTSAIGTTANNNFIGTTDAKDFVFASNNLERMRLSSAGNLGVGTIAPTATALVTINPTTNALRNGIDMTMSGATSTATGLNITTGNSNVNGITVTHSSASVATSLYGIGAVLSSTNIVSGFNAYRNGSGLSYGVYGINGTNASYATNANTWAAFLQGRTVISSESSPTSPLGTDLEVRNTTTGAAAPATISMRQTNALTTSGNILTNLNFGDNNITGGQAQIQTIRGAASSGAGDLPTDMLFYTTPDASATLTERMRIANTGYVGIGGTPITSLDVNGAYSARFSTAIAAAAVVIPNNVTLFRLSAVAAVQANALSVATPQDGQFLTIINEDGDPATFAGYTIPALSGSGAGVGSFVYTGASALWRQISSAPAASSTGWNITGNAGTTASTSAIGTAANNNFIGTTDTKDFVIATNNLERMRVGSGGNIGIGVAPSAITHINGAYSSAFGSGFGSQGIYYIATSTNATNNNNHTGAQFQGKAATASKVKNLYGVEGDAFMGASTASTLSSGQVVGVYGTASAVSGIASTNVGEVYGVLGMPQFFDPLNATNTAGVAAELLMFAGTETNASLFKGICNAGDISAGTITNLYGINIPVLSKTGGTVTNAYGAWIENPTAGTNNYGAYFGGNVGVGVTTPAQALDVAGNIKFSQALMPNNLPGTAGQVLTSAGAGAPPTWTTIAAGSGWGLTGNAGTDGGTTNFLGTTDAKALSIRVNNLKSGLIDPAAGGSTFFGYQSGKNTLPGDNVKCTAMGYQALTVSSGSTHNSAFGYVALSANTDGTANTAVGSLSMQSNVHGVQNTAVGVNSLNANAGDGSSTGIGNTAIGYQTIYFNSTGNYNTALGYEAYTSGNFTNSMVLGADPTGVINPTANNMVNIGDHSITSIKGQVAFGTYSDGRVKDNIKEDVPGLAFITQLRPVTYNYDLDKEIQLSGGKKTVNWDGKYDIEKIKFSGFIAQEVEASAKKIGYDFSGVDKPKNDKDLYSLRYSDFVVPLVKSVQELNTENEKLKAKVETLSEDNKEMKAELDKIKSMLEVNVK